MQPGPSVSLKCSAAGNPTPQISWLLDGFPLPQNDRLLIGQYVTVYGDVISHVNITTVKPEDGGEYECIAGSRAGEARHSARLNIYGESAGKSEVSTVGHVLPPRNYRYTTAAISRQLKQTLFTYLAKTLFHSPRSSSELDRAQVGRAVHLHGGILKICSISLFIFYVASSL